MSEITRHKCDRCGKEVDDRYSEIGWIYLRVEGRIEFYYGREQDSSKIKAGCLGSIKSLTQTFADLPALDFCSLGCFSLYFKQKLIEGAKNADVDLIFVAESEPPGNPKYERPGILNT